jgi:hypothetical protein
MCALALFACGPEALPRAIAPDPTAAPRTPSPRPHTPSPRPRTPSPAALRTAAPTVQADAATPLPPASIVELRTIGSARARIEVIEFSDYQ